MRLVPVLLALLPAAALAQTPVATPAPAKAVDDDNRMICKKFPVTGSLVQSTRVCKEKHYWDLEYAVRRQTTVTNSCGATAEGGLCDTTSGFGTMGRSTLSPQ